MKPKSKEKKKFVPKYFPYPPPNYDHQQSSHYHQFDPQSQGGFRYPNQPRVPYHNQPRVPYQNQPRFISHNQVWNKYGWNNGYNTANYPVRPRAPRPPQQTSEEQKEFQLAKNRVTAERVDAYVKEMSRKFDVQKKVEILKEKLMTKKKECSVTSSDIDKAGGSFDRNFSEDPDEDSRTAVISSNQKFREPIMDVFDFTMTNKDYRYVGSGHVPNAESLSNDESVPSNAYEVNRANKNPCQKSDVRRVANQRPPNSKKKRKKNANSLSKHVAEIDPTILDSSSKEREEYERVAEKLKGAIREKDKSWLSNLVNSKTSVASKRILLSKLMEENHASISRELAAIRFSGNCIQAATTTENDGNIEVTEADLELIRSDNCDDVRDVDFSDLPDELFSQIEDFIKREVPDVVVDCDEIVEVPAPVKPPVEVVTLDDNSVSADQNPFSILKMLADEESSLFDQLKLIDEQKHEIMGRLYYLHELRLQIMEKNLASTNV